MIAAAFAALGMTSPVAAQKDAAEKAQEGSVEHWIEYYKGQQRKPIAAPAETAPAPVNSVAPADRSGSDSSLPEKIEGQ